MRRRCGRISGGWLSPLQTGLWRRRGEPHRRNMTRSQCRRSPGRESIWTGTRSIRRCLDTETPRHSPSLRSQGERGLQTNNGRGSLECVDWLLISLCHDKLLLETMNECDHYYQIKISWSWPLHCTVSVSHSLSPRIVLLLTITFVSIFRVFIFFTHSTLIERPMI